MNNKKGKSVNTILVIAFISFVGILTETSLNVTLPALMKQFGIALDVAQWLTTGYLLAIAIIMLSSSYQNKRFSAKQLFRFSCIAFIGGSVVCALAPSFSVLLIGRIISAFGAGICTPLMFNVIVEIMPRPKWGFYMGVAGLVIAMAPTLGPAFGGLIDYLLNWRWIFVIVAVFALVVFLIGLGAVGQYHEIQKEKFPYTDYLILSLSFVSLILGVNQLSKGLSNWLLWLYLGLFLILGYLYYVSSNHSKNKLLNLQVFKFKTFVYGSIAYFLLQFVNIGISFVLPNYAQIVMHCTSLVSGLILLPGNIIAGALNPYFGRLYDKLGAKPLLYLGASLMCISSLLFGVWGISLTVVILMVIFSILMLGHRMSFSNTLAEALKNEPQELQSDATAVCQTAQQLAGSLGTSILAAIIAISQNAGGASYSFLIARGSQWAFYFVFVLSVLILVCDWKMLHLEKER